MHYVLHVIHNSANDLENTISSYMAPFHEELEVDPYKVYISEKASTRALDWAEKSGKTFSSHTELLSWFTGNVIDFEPFIYDVTDSNPDTGYYYMTTSNPQGKWDWWVIGGRWDNYFRTGNTVTVKEALDYLDNPEYSYQEFGPQDYITLDGSWVGKTTYNPDGEGYDENDPDSIFPLNPDYMYKEYLTHVKDIPGLFVTVVDYHC